VAGSGEALLPVLPEGTAYRGFRFDGPVPPSVSAQRPDKPFGSAHRDLSGRLAASSFHRPLSGSAADCRFDGGGVAAGGADAAAHAR